MQYSDYATRMMIEVENLNLKLRTLWCKNCSVLTMLYMRNSINHRWLIRHMCMPKRGAPI